MNTTQPPLHPKSPWLALFGGLLSVFAYAPFRIFPLAFAGLVLLLFSLQAATPGQAAKRGWLFGAALFAGGIYWVFISLYRYGHLPVAAALPATAVFIACLASFPALACWLLNRYFPGTPDNPARLLAFPALWVLVEWVRSWVLSGFPWLSLGYSQTYSPLKALAPVLGLPGVSLAAALSAALMLQLFFPNRRRYAAFCLASLWGGCCLLSLIVWTAPAGKPVTVSLVQGNIPEQIKWSSDQLSPTLDTYTRLSAPLWQNSDLIIWPESAIPDFLDSQQPFLDHIDTLAKSHHAAFLTGIPVRLAGQSGYYNAVVAFGEGHGFYLKQRLVPFGEFIPFQRFLSGLLTRLDIPFLDFRPGPSRAPPLTAGLLRLSTFICYETAFPELGRFQDLSVNALLAVSNDAWFGHSSAQSQHLDMAAMRALETGRPLLFVANDGPTALIGPTGTVLASLPAHRSLVLTAQIQPMQGKTPWLVRGMDPLLMIVSTLLAGAVWRRRTNARTLLAAAS